MTSRDALAKFLEKQVFEHSTLATCNFETKTLLSRKSPRAQYTSSLPDSCTMSLWSNMLAKKPHSRKGRRWYALHEPTIDLLEFAMSDLNLSARAYDRVLKLHVRLPT